MLEISRKVQLAAHEIDMHAVQSGGPGGQNVNKVATAIHLRFDIKASSLPDVYKARLLALNDQRVTKDGVLVIKCSEARTQEKNRKIALQRLQHVIRSVMVMPKKRIATKPTKSSVRKRVEAKRQRKQIKKMRGKVSDY